MTQQQKWVFMIGLMMVMDVTVQGRPQPLHVKRGIRLVDPKTLRIIPFPTDPVLPQPLPEVPRVVKSPVMEPGQASIPRKSHSRSYTYNYRVNNLQQTGDFKVASESREGDTVTGGYQILEPDGRTLRIVTYRVTPETGFQAEVKYKKLDLGDPRLSPTTNNHKSTVAFSVGRFGRRLRRPTALNVIEPATMPPPMKTPRYLQQESRLANEFLTQGNGAGDVRIPVKSWSESTTKSRSETSLHPTTPIPVTVPRKIRITASPQEITEKAWETKTRQWEGFQPATKTVPKTIITTPPPITATVTQSSTTTSATQPSTTKEPPTPTTTFVKPTTTPATIETIVDFTIINEDTATSSADITPTKQQGGMKTVEDLAMETTDTPSFLDQTTVAEEIPEQVSEVVEQNPTENLAESTIPPEVVSKLQTEAEAKVETTTIVAPSDLPTETSQQLQSTEQASELPPDVTETTWVPTETVTDTEPTELKPINDQVTTTTKSQAQETTISDMEITMNMKEQATETIKAKLATTEQLVPTTTERLTKGVEGTTALELDLTALLEGNADGIIVS
ncbi:unnamed protein product [Darwinula stevensoni]|uniref:Uncharacterized protein n=1 Tax=Darwinula stevensoni TaxID=69355 RepID=A0A7R8ZZT7_9CRUS|nr:unnamed protein product [Darwinula stevensoni]CAG0879483.1 unnamed protein product [Darwinula stevensoni]